MGADSLVCGSENGNTDYIIQAAEARDSAEYPRRLKELEKDDRSRGEGSAVLNDRAMRELGFSLGANDKLAAEYVRNLKGKGDVGFRVFPRIRGEGAVPYQSATALRQMIYGGALDEGKPYIPEEAFEVYSEKKGESVDPSRYSELAHVFFRLFYHGESTAEGEGGLLERIRSAAEETCSAEAFFEAIRTRKYTDARIRRAMLFAMLRVKREVLKMPPPYTVLLAANGKGREYLSEIRKNGTFPIVTKPSDVPTEVEEIYSLLRAADGLYTMCFDPIAESNLYIKKHPTIRP
jgi:predicted nucleotidyltransferase